MEAFLKSLLIGSHGLFAYLTIFGVLMACGVGVPLPEDVSLLLGGYLAHRGAVVLWGMIFVGFLGILAGDSLIYLAGRRVALRAAHVPTGWIARVVTKEKRAKVESLFKKHGEQIILVARFLPGIRVVAFFVAGTVGMGYGKFVLYDGLASLASAPIIVYLGYRFGERLHVIIEKIKQGQLAIVLAVVALLLGSFLWRRIKARRALPQEKATHGAAGDQTSANLASPRPPSSERVP